jgi:hypothetical protein
MEPVENAALEFLRRGAEGSAVVGSGDFPELGVGGQRVNSARVADGDVAVDFTVDEKDWDIGRGGGIFRRNLIHVEVVLPAGTEEGDFNQGTEQRASYPGGEVEGLSLYFYDL